MRRFLLTVVALLVFAGQMFAAPVDVATAKKLGVSYLKNNVASAKSITDVEHVYTVSGDNGVPSLYVFNYENGFVIVAADDRAYPILAYSEESTFDVNHLPDGLVYYLGHYSDEIQYAIENDFVAEEEIAKQWELLRTEGITSRTRMDHVVDPLITTKWNQDYPYNYYAPAHNYGPGGRCYAGCVATSMSQVMRFWSWPDQGVGEHSYNTSTVGGTLSANFGETTYNWSNMPNTIPSGSPQAIALLMYHCGVSVDMDFNYNGSGSQTYKVVDAAKTYFKYCSATEILSRESYTKTAWEDILIEQFDHGFPAAYAGYDEQMMGHAFNCDGYDAQRKFHFNWGWSGWCDGFFAIDALNTLNGTFNLNQRVIVNMIPDYIYNALVPAAENVEVAIENVMTKTGTVTFTVPTTSMSGDPLTSIEKMELKRNNLVVKTFNNPTPGETLVYEDEVSDFGAYEYSICGYNNNYMGEITTVSVIYGPNCTWKFTLTCGDFQGWNSGAVQVVADNGAVIGEFTNPNSSPSSQKFQMPEGGFSLKWVEPNIPISTLSIKLKNSANQEVYSYSGASSGLNGTLYTGSNDCEGCTSPTDLAGEYSYQDGHNGALISWNCTYDPQKYKVYRSNDGVEYQEIATVENTEHQYFDASGNGTFYYRVTAYNSYCESTPALTSDDKDFIMVNVLSVEENSINARIYPNPTNGAVRIEAESINNVSVFNVVGQRVFEQNISENQYIIDMKQFGNGIYMIRIETANGSMKQKISVID